MEGRRRHRDRDGSSQLWRCQCQARRRWMRQVRWLGLGKIGEERRLGHRRENNSMAVL